MAEKVLEDKTWVDYLSTIKVLCYVIVLCYFYNSVGEVQLLVTYCVLLYTGC